MLVCLIISLTGISPLLLGISSAAELDATKYLLKGQLAPFNGYLVSPMRFEKALIALHDLESTKELLTLKTKYFEEKLAAEKVLVEQQLAAEQAEALAVEKELKAKIADLDVWYRKPWVVAVGVAAVFIATGALIP